MIGVFNIFGTITAGALGGRYPKRLLLAGIYMARTVLFSWFILTPMTPVTVLIFITYRFALARNSASDVRTRGLYLRTEVHGYPVWLSVPVAPDRSFVGVWLGGDFYDRFGSYDVVWWVGVATGLLSAVVHLPVREMPINDRLATTQPHHSG